MSFFDSFVVQVNDFQHTKSVCVHQASLNRMHVFLPFQSMEQLPFNNSLSILFEQFQWNSESRMSLPAKRNVEIKSLTNFTPENSYAQFIQLCPNRINNFEEFEKVNPQTKIASFSMLFFPEEDKITESAICIHIFPTIEKFKYSVVWDSAQSKFNISATPSSARYILYHCKVMMNDIHAPNNRKNIDQVLSLIQTKFVDIGMQNKRDASFRVSCSLSEFIDVPPNANFPLIVCTMDTLKHFFTFSQTMVSSINYPVHVQNEARWLFWKSLHENYKLFKDDVSIKN